MVEILVSLALSGLLMSAAFGLISLQYPVYEKQVQLQNSQQSLWMATELIQRDLRRAGMGFGVCPQTQLRYWPRSSAQPLLLQAVAVVDGGDGAPDELQIAYAEPPSVGIGEATLGVAIGNVWTTTELSVNDSRGFMTPVGCQCTGGTACALAGSGTTANPYPLALLFSPVVTTPPTQCALVQITAAQCTGSGAELLTYAQKTEAPLNSAGGTPSVTNAFPIGTQVANLQRLHRLRYFVDRDTDPNSPRLLRVDDPFTPAQVIALGIEDFQVVPACDVNANGAIEPEGSSASARVVDEWFYNEPGDTVPAGCTAWPAVRIALSSRTSSQDRKTVAAPRPAMDNRLASSVPDHFQRRVLRKLVTVPNVGL
jgi:hypothetical protein